MSKSPRQRKKKQRDRTGSETPGSDGSRGEGFQSNVPGYSKAARSSGRRLVPIATFALSFALGLGASLGLTAALRSGGGHEGATGAASSIGTGGRGSRAPGSRELGALLASAGSSLRQERYAEAFRDFSRAIQLAPTDGRGYHGLAEVYQRIDRNELAEAPLRTAVQRDPSYLPAKLLLAKVLRRLGKQEETIRILEALLVDHPGDPVLIWELALNQIRLGRPERAVPLLETYLRRFPNFAYGVATLGRARAEAGDLSGAERDYDAALKLDPMLTMGWLWLGQLRVAMGQKDEAETALVSFRRLRGLEEQMRHCERDLLRRPDNLQVLVRLANIRAALGRYEAARIPLKRALELAPGQPQLEALQAEIEKRLAETDTSTAAEDGSEKPETPIEDAR